MSPSAPLFGPLDRSSRLPDVPGGWTQQTIAINGRVLDVLMPARPDEFLEDPRVLEANRRDDYMPYWPYLWPAAEPMARAIVHAPWPAGTDVLEIGSGIGVVGLAALARGDAVTFSDYDPTSIELCRRNALRNGLPEPQTLLLDWRSPVERQFPAIIGCEVTYDRQNHPILLDLIARMLTPNGCCWLGDPGRSQSPHFHRDALARGFAVRVLNAEGVEYTPTFDQFQIFELRLR